MMSSSYGYRESESAWAIVFGPMAVLATIFALTWSTTIANRYLGFSSPSTILSMGALAFGLATVVCAYVGRRHLRRVEHLSRSDSLTRLPNRRALHFDIQREYRQGHEVALAMIDLDGFKLINDHYGHFVGDAAIRECARIFGDISDGEAGIYRLGGDEYAMMIGGPVAGTLLEGLCRRIIADPCRRPAPDPGRVHRLGAQHHAGLRPFLRIAAPRGYCDVCGEARRQDALHLVQFGARPQPRKTAGNGRRVAAISG